MISRKTIKGALTLTACLETALFMTGTTRAGDDVSSKSISVSGSLRSLTGATVNYKNPIIFGSDRLGEGLSTSLLRLTLVGRPVDWLGFEVHGVQSLEFDTMPSTSQGMTALPGLGAASGKTRYRAFDASWQWAGANDAAIMARLWLDRCNVKFSFPFADFTVGRQAINFGKAYFWNPLDIFLPFDPRQFDRDYKPGVDALRIDLPLGDVSGINVIGVLGRKLSLPGSSVQVADENIRWYGSAVLARVFTTLRGFDMAMQAGKIYGGFQLGGGWSGEIGPLEFRGEVAYFFSTDSQQLPFPLSGTEYHNYLSGVVGLGHRFENTLMLEAEYFFNGLGDPNRLESAFIRQISTASLQASRHLLGLVASYELLPILTTQLAWIQSFSDGSCILQPGLTLSLANEADFIFGALLAFGARPKSVSLESPLGLRSEFGTYPNIYYFEFKYYY